jgi:glucokinase
MSERLALTIDIGGTQSRVALIDGRSQIIKRASVPTESREGHKVVIEEIRKLVSQREFGRVAGIGISIAGLLKLDTGTLVYSPNMPGWVNVPIKQIFSDEFHLPVYVSNDASLAALGEHRYGAAKGLDNFIYITVSTGIGGGMVLDGRLYLGADGYAGEVGHMTIDPDGPVCSCGMRGCFEAMASGTAIARDAKERIAACTTSMISEMVGGDLEKITAATVEQAARQGDGLAKDLMYQAAVNLGIGLSSLIIIFNPDAVVVGGGVTKSNELIFEPARKVVAKRAVCYLRRDVPILKAVLKDNVGLIGAAAMVFDNV